ncbi:unnamed protein product [Angiostrongylus costaricensis]|uniref:ML domain-containing protein n=1 Tax=Angiostrongylus costaricensis TaxID=334426 RepID=A0A158PHM1_ANGCS|nr:unnamed protein product [Angiostrongylus costaricensis]
MVKTNGTGSIERGNSGGGGRCVGAPRRYIGDETSRDDTTMTVSYQSKFKIVDVEALGCGLKDTPNGKKLCEFKDETTPQIRIKFIPSVKCPVEEGKESVYEKGIEIISNYPKDETVQVNWLLNKDKEKAVCIIFLARIVA